MKKWGVFLDRDGTVNEEREYIGSTRELKLIPGVAQAIRLLNKRKIKVIVVTNQSGVARGYFTEDKIDEIHKEIQDRLRKRGARIDAFYYCPHHPVFGKGVYKKDCICRKPRTGMLKKATREHNLDLARSFLIGDKTDDVETGHRAGCRTILVLTGYGSRSRDELINRKLEKPDCIKSNLLEAVKWLLRNNAGALKKR